MSRSRSAQVTPQPVDPLKLGLGFLDETAHGDALAQHLHYYDTYLTWGLVERTRYPLLERAQELRLHLER